jgi:RHS repeat-associated protein
LSINDVIGNFNDNSGSFTVAIDVGTHPRSSHQSSDVGRTCISRGTTPFSGSPIDLYDGEKREQVVALRINTPAGELSFARTYRQSKLNDAAYAFMGLGWTHNHSSKLVLTGTAPNRTAEAQLPGGGLLRLQEANGSPGHFNPDPGSNAVLDYDSGLSQYVLTLLDRSTYVFDATSLLLKKRTWPNAETWTYTYVSGKLDKVADGYARELRFAYVSSAGFDNGQLWRVGDHTSSGLTGSSPTGRYIQFSYVTEKLNGSAVSNPRALLSSIRDARTAVWTYDWYGQDVGETDSNRKNFLVEVRSPLVDTDGNGTDDTSLTLKQLAYTMSASVITAITQKLGIQGAQAALAETVYAFQPSGANLTTETRVGLEIDHTFAGGVYSGMTNPAGGQTTQSLDGNYQVSRQQDANGNATDILWNDTGKFIDTVIDAKGNDTRFIYNETGASADTLSYSRDAEGRQTEYVYGDSVNPRLPTIVRVRESNSPPATLLREQQFSYDSKGRTLTEKLVDPTNTSIVLQQTTREYYTSGDGNGLLFRLKQHDVQQPGSTVDTEYTYDQAGRVSKTRQVSTFGSCQYSYSLYDAAGNVTRSVCSTTDLATPATAVTTADIKVTVHQYDSLGRRVKTIANYVDGVYNPSAPTEDQATLTVYDALDRVIRTISTYVPDASIPNPYTAAHSSFPHGTEQNQNLVSDTGYNARGMVRKQTDVLGNVTLFGYDNAGRLVKTVQSASNPTYNNDYTGSSPDPTLANYSASSWPDQDIITASQYDAAGNLVRSVDALGSQHFTVYDVLNRPVKTVRSAKDSATVSLNPGDSGYDAANDPRSSSYVPDSAADRDLIETSEYDAMGRIVRSTDVLGRVTRTVYDTLGRVSRSIGSYVAQGSSDPANWVWEAGAWKQAPGGTAIDHGTRNDQNLISLTVYDTTGRVLYTQDTLGRRTWQQYDGFGRVVKTIANAVGTATDGSANDPRSASYVPSTDPDKDRISTTQYDGNGRVIETQDALKRRSRSVYDGLGRVKKTVANCTGTGTAADADNYVGSSNADDDIITKTEYDSFGRVFKTINALGRETRYVYDAAGRRYQTIVNYVDGVYNPAEPDRDLIQTTRYDLAGRVERSTDARGTVTVFGYDRAGRRLWVKAAAETPLESQSYTGYDKAGRVLRTVAGYVPLVDSAGQVISPDAKDGNGNWLFAPTTFGPHNDENLISRFSYDRLGRRIETVDPMGNTTTTVYNKGGQVISQSETNVAVIGTATTVTSRFGYDGLGRRWRVIQNYVAQGTSDPANWVWESGAWKQAPGGTAIQHGTDADQNIIVDVSYDRAGRMLSQREPRGNLTTTSYDLLDRRTQRTDPLGTTWTTSYEDLKTGGTANGRTRTTLRYPGLSGLANYDVRRDSDRMGRLASIDYNVTAPQTPYTTPNVTLSYDKLGSRLSLIEHNGVSNVRRTLFTPDQAGRVTQAQFDNDGNGTVDETVSYAYDAGGLRTRLTLPGGWQISYGYDARGQLTSLTDGDGQGSAFVYDRVGRHTGSERPNGMTSRYQHDPAGRLRLLRHMQGSKLLARFQFEVDGRGNRVSTLETLARPATVMATLDRNHAAVSYTGTWSDTGGFRRTTEFWGRLSLTVSGQELRLVVGTGPDHGRCDVYVDGSLWETYDGYTPAAGERRLAIYLDKGGSHSLELRNRPDKQTASTGFVVRFKQLDVLATNYDSQSLRYEYDALSRLRLADYYAGLLFAGTPTRRYLYTFDRSGNRTQQSLSLNGGTATVTNYTYNAANQLIQAGSANLTYDSNGNMLNDGTNAYTWDRANRLLSIGGVSYKYDGEGRRVQQSVGATVTQFLLDLQPGLSVTLSEATGAAVTRYVHAPRGIHAQKDSSGNWDWMMQDGLGSVRAVADNDAGVLWNGSTAPYGDYFSEVGTRQSNYGFTGEYTDPITGQVHLRARDYNPALGVFGSLDPFEGMTARPMSLNGYAWVEGNVVNAVDSTGLIYEFPGLWEKCLSPRSTAIARLQSSLVNDGKRIARNATIVVRLVNYMPGSTVNKTCDSEEYRQHPERFTISSGGLGTLTDQGLWTHDHFEDRSMNRNLSGEESQAISNISSHDCIQFIGKGNRFFMAKTAALYTETVQHLPFIMLLPSSFFDGSGSLVSLSSIADPAEERRISGCGYPCDMGLYYAHLPKDFNIYTNMGVGVDINQVVWSNVDIGNAGFPISSDQPTPQAITFINENGLSLTITGYQFYPEVNPCIVNGICDEKTHQNLKPGDSGGGVFDWNGRLVGVTVAEIDSRDETKGGIFVPILSP